ncbi:MAG: FtsQ-type POTRA domain-containing protein [bacterium]
MSKKYIKNCTGDHCESNNVKQVIFSKVIFYLLLISFIAVTIYIVFFSPYLKISNIVVAGAKELDNAQLQAVVGVSLDGKYLGIIPRNNFLFISQGKVEKILSQNFKKIKTIKVSKRFPDSVDINIEERNALLVWCSNEKCFMLDENGIAYSEADFSSQELIQNNLLQIVDKSGKEVEIGSDIVDFSYEQYMLGIKDQLAKIGFEIIDQYFTPSRMAQEINVKTSQGTEFYFSTQYSLEGAMKTLETIFKKEITGDKKNNVAYFDLRNENKVFYKLKNAEQTVSVDQAVNVEAKKVEKKK